MELTGKRESPIPNPIHMYYLTLFPARKDLWVYYTFRIRCVDILAKAPNAVGVVNKPELYWQRYQEKDRGTIE